MSINYLDILKITTPSSKIIFRSFLKIVKNYLENNTEINNTEINIEINIKNIDNAEKLIQQIENIIKQDPNFEKYLDLKITNVYKDIENDTKSTNKNNIAIQNSINNIIINDNE